MHLRSPVFTIIAVGFFQFVIRVTQNFLCDKMSFPVKTFYSKVKMKVVQSCLTLCDPMDCSPPGFSVHGIPLARILEWVAIPFSRGLPNLEIDPWSPALQADSLPSDPPEKPEPRAKQRYLSEEGGNFSLWEQRRLLELYFKLGLKEGTEFQEREGLENT